MPRMIDLIRASAVPANLVQSAARGTLAIPANETLEILVYLATENKTFGEQARLTLAGWEEAACRAAISNPATAQPILAYFSSPGNFRPALIPALLANPSVTEESLAQLSASIPRDMVETVLRHDRASRSGKILSALGTNPNLNGIQSATIDERISMLASPDPIVAAPPEIFSEPAVDASREPQNEPDTVPLSQEDQEAEETASKYITEHATEIAAEAQKPFQPIGGIYEEAPAEAEPSVAKTVAATAAAGGAEPPVTVTPEKKVSIPVPAVPKRGSALQRISTLDVKGRIQLAMKGSKEERALLVRDGTKIVALAVLDSPKISDGEVEKFAGQKNVLEAVLRAIPMKRRFMKQYNIVRNLVFNPRTPIDVSLGLMKNILVADLKILSGNKEVSDTVRKLALRNFKQKLSVDK
jgi:hypothetical protein